MLLRRCALIESFSSKFAYLLSGNRNQSKERFQRRDVILTNQSSDIILRFSVSLIAKSNLTQLTQPFSSKLLKFQFSGLYFYELESKLFDLFLDFRRCDGYL